MKLKKEAKAGCEKTNKKKKLKKEAKAGCEKTN